MLAIILIGIVLLALVGTVVGVRRKGLRRPDSPPPTVSPPLSEVETPPSVAGETSAQPRTAPAPELDGTALVEEAPPNYKERLGRSRGLFASLRSRVGSGRVDAAALEDLEAALLGADVGVSTTDHVLEIIRSKAAAGELDDASDLLGALRTELLAILAEGPDGPIDRRLDYAASPGRVPVWLFVGVNGVGKTTTIGKLSARESGEGRTVLLAAGDTFRAAAADQLAMWAERTGAEVVRGAEGGDPSSVVFDAIQRAGARGADLVLADTAGRLHTKVNLVEELKKVRRVADREPGEVIEVLLVLDGTTGQNAVAQAREFSEAVGATGVVLTKLDGTARGGVVVAIQRELGLPVKLVGLGEGAGDLVDFDPESFVDALLEP
jgi:fused signal recognition particle receptor